MDNSRQLFLRREFLNSFTIIDSNTEPVAIDTRISPNASVAPIKLRFFSNRPSAKPCQSNNIILLMINSAPKNYERRSSIRETWGKPDFIRNAFGNHAWRTIFIIGDSYSKTLNNIVDTEALKYGDIVLADFGDSFRNLTYKTVFGMEWANLHCNTAKYYYKGDDDVMLNPSTLFRKLASKESKKLFIGHVMSSCLVNRQEYNRYYVSEKDLPISTYPDYCSGFSYVISMDVVRSMVTVVPKVRKIPIDDAYVGMLAKEIKLKPRDDPGFRPFGPIPNELCEYNKVIAVHGIPSSLLKSMAIKSRKALLGCV
ncbi:uncharacterized protein TRIADDRAFT_51471 [Trichoplax adhaerens]|uniref:Hexosyltransferase n=1 Tax=Trichoplax adhaerens TaxID=10228 RepID=B3RJA8_TRIAD|nr:hypothetical protein TRIADDRAFT_51471 [Trichoplax adhaerens]EDV29297.1 hypothetical protein TRIADDRAFT_51471 [Trichoplax adhaerens]|eukprot:XP_002108499.1 hypothetical protein TRIADDRAFT_51471 [Trichoplax adhaerens]